MDTVVNLLEKYRPGLYAAAYRIVGDGELATDILQTAAVRFLEKASLLHSLSEGQAFTYMAVTVKRLALDQIQAGKKRATVPLPDDGEAAPVSASCRLPSAEELYIRSENNALLRQAVERLDEREQSLLFMKYFEELSNAEIGQELGLKTDSVRATLSRVRRKLLACLTEGGYVRD